MHYIVIAIIFFWSLYQTIRRGPAGAFVYAFLPVLLCLSIIKPISVTGLPDIFSPLAVSYGVLVGMLVSGRFPAFKPHLIDWIVLACSLTVILTGYYNGVFWTLVAITGTETLRWLVPYYMARLAFRDPGLRRTMGLLFCWVAMAVGTMGLIEFRLWPLFFSRMLEVFGSTPFNDIVHPQRMGFFRAMVTCEHPIDLGNTGVLLAGLIPAMAIAGGVRLKDWRVIGGILASGAIVIESISFSSFIGLAVAGSIFATLYFIRNSELFLVPLTIAAIVGGFVFTNHLLSIDLQAIKPASEKEQLEGSFYVRTLIVQNSWNTFGKDAGWIGFGDINIDKKVLGLDSVDNSYMLFLMRRGWVHLSLRLVLAIMVAYVGMKMLRQARTPATRLPAAAFVAALMGIMVSMYTVWFGFVYAVLWTCTLAMTVTMRQMMAEQAFAALGRGFAVLPPRGVARPLSRPGEPAPPLIAHPLPAR
jgi:hypothetical protein